jgi:hypothetical protein
VVQTMTGVDLGELVHYRVFPFWRGKMSHLIHNEQMKLAANLFNNLAVVSLASGFIAPIFSVRPSATPIGFSESGYANFGGLTINMLLGIFLGLVCCGVFAVVAQSFLLKLRE